MKKAFTLAEVLITLGIIGVVAAMTLPTVIANYKKQVMATQAKKGYNIIMNMMAKIQADEGASNIYSSSLFTDGVCSNGREQNCEEQYGNPSKLEKIITKYLNVVKTCKGAECNISYDMYNYINNHKFITSSSWKSTMGTLYDWSTAQGFYTNDGMIIYVIPGGYGVPVLTFAFDTNGEKGPNIEGRDFFCIQKCADGTEYYNLHQNECGGNDKDTRFPLGYLMSNGWKMDY